jgi:hypothetical protein
MAKQKEVLGYIEELSRRTEVLTVNEQKTMKRLVDSVAAQRQPAQASLI